MAEEEDFFGALISQLEQRKLAELEALNISGKTSGSAAYDSARLFYDMEISQAKKNADIYSAETPKDKSQELFYYGFKDIANFDISERIKSCVSYFYNQSNSQQAQIRERLGQHFNAHGFDVMPRGDVLIFFDQFQKGMLAVNMAPENLQKMAEMLAIMPQSEPAGNMTISHGKFNFALNFNRWRRRYTLNNAARDLQRVQGKYAEKLAKLEYDFNGNKEAYAQALKDRKIVNRWYQAINPIAWGAVAANQIKQNALDDDASKRLYEMTDAEYSTKMVHANSFSFYWYKAANGVSKFLKLTREAKENRIAELESKTLGASVWNPLHWHQRLELKLLQKSKFRQEKKSIADMKLNQLALQEEALKQRVAALSQEIELGGDLQKIARLKKEKEGQALLLAEATRVRSIKQKDYETAKKTLKQRLATNAKPLEQKVSKRYRIINEKTDFLDYSTPTGKFLYAVLQKAPGTQKKQLEALVLERKRQEFESEAQFIQFVTNQLQYGGHTKIDKSDLMTVIANAVAKEEGRGWSSQSNSSLESADETLGENTGENSSPDRVHEGHSSQPPAPDPTWQQQSEQELKNSYEASAYELVSPQREGPHADDENVLYQTFKSKEDDHTVTVERPTANDYNLSAKDKDGKDTVPSVDDMKAVMESIKKSGHKTMELGEIKSPEFLARAVAAAEESGIEITNLKEVKERLSNSMGQEQFEQRYGQDHKRETEKRQAEAIERSGFTKDLNVKEGNKVDKTVRGLNALAAVSKMSSQEYEEYKKTDDFKSQKLTKNQIKILDGIKKLQQEEKEGKITSKDKRYIRTLSQMIEDYQAIGNRYSDKGKKEVAQKAFARGVVQRASMQQRQSGR